MRDQRRSPITVTQCYHKGRAEGVARRTLFDGAPLGPRQRSDRCSAHHSILTPRFVVTGQSWPQPSMPGPFRQVYLDVKGEQSIEQLCLAIKMMLAEPAARNLFAAVLE